MMPATPDPDQPPVPPDVPKTPGERQDRALELLKKNPPLPPAPSDPRWSWTAARLKAVYLDAFTDLGRAEIAELVGCSRRGFFKWTQQPDYKRYLAELVFSDGLADKVSRAKTRKAIADKLAAKVLDRLASGNVNAERLPDLVRSLESLLTGLREDATDWERKASGAALAPDSGPRRSGLDLVERINAIADPGERATVKRHLLSLFREYIGADQDAAAAQAAAVDAPAEPTARPSSMPDAAQVSSLLDVETPAELETTGETQPGELSADMLEPGETAPEPEHQKAE
jgi:hypothetical protein